MPFVSKRSKLRLTEEETTWLQQVSQSRSQAAGQVQRAEILLRYHGGETVSRIAAALRTNRPRVERCLAKALELGVRGALQDLPGRGRHPSLTAEARAWVVALACQKPKALGYAQELWTTRLLARHVRQQAGAAGHASLPRLARGTVTKILGAHAVHPHKIQYYLERRDPEFEEKMAQVLYVYKEVQIWREVASPGELTAVISYDEKPGIQAVGNTAPDLAPVPNQHPRSPAIMSTFATELSRFWRELTCFLEMSCHRAGAPSEAGVHRIPATAGRPVQARARIRLVLDNHSAHISRETRSFLGTRPNRFEFTFTPTHGSWLNLIESFFGKMARTLLRGIRVKSKEELKTRIEMYLREVNEEPVIFRWKYKLETLSVV